MLDKKEKAAAYRSTLRAKKQREQQEAFDKQCQENLDKGLTFSGYTRTFEGQSITFYLNNTAITAEVDYHQSTPHIEFRGKPSILTETGYRSHFMQGDLNQWASLKEVVESEVKYIIRQEKKKTAKYTLTWAPSLEYLKHSPEQLTLFGEKEAALC